MIPILLEDEKKVVFFIFSLLFCILLLITCVEMFKSVEIKQF